MDLRLFQPQDDPAAQAELLSAVKLVEVEVHSFCNRKCWMCPNSVIDRRHTPEFLPEAVYLRVMADLAELDWRGEVSFGRYNEPFSNAVFYPRLRQAREALPKAKLRTNSNGDFLTPDRLELAHRCGLDEVHIQLYFGRDEQFTRTAAEAKLDQLAKRLPLAWNGPRQAPDVFVWHANHNGLAVRAVARNFRATGTNRCGLDVHGPYVRKALCVEPCLRIYIDYTGDAMPCCNLRHDFPAHGPYILGRLDDKPGSLARIFCSAKAAKFRLSLMNHKPKTGPCADCYFGRVPEYWDVQHTLREIKKFGLS